MTTSNEINLKELEDSNILVRYECPKCLCYNESNICIVCRTEMNQKKVLVQLDLVNQFLSDKLNRIEKEIDNYHKDKGTWHKYYIRTKDIKQIIRKEFTKQ